MDTDSSNKHSQNKSADTTNISGATQTKSVNESADSDKKKVEFYTRDSIQSPATPADSTVKLTDLSTGGGCGCKIEPAALHKMLKDVPRHLNHEQLLVGIAHKDDAAVYKMSDDLALVFTNDFFTPMIDDPYTYGRIAAANALSDVYAMGGEPIMANAIVGMPVNKLPMDYMQSIMKGGVDICHEAGIPLSGGHSIDNPQPIYGLAVVGKINPKQIKTNSSAKPGDLLIITKPLGIGVISTGIKLGKLDTDTNADFLPAITEVNKVGHWLGQQEHVHAMTDITGFGLAGHLVEMAEGANVSMRIDTAAVPVLTDVYELIKEGVVPTGAYRNLDAYDEQIMFNGENWDVDDKLIFTDPQTNGGLLFSIDPSAESYITSELIKKGYFMPTVIGEVKVDAGDSKRVIFDNHFASLQH